MSERLKPEAWQFYQNGDWHIGMNVHNHRENTETAGIPTRDLYAIPEGYALVPVDPNKAMRDAFWHELSKDEYTLASDTWRAMITAAQEEAK